MKVLYFKNKESVALQLGVDLSNKLSELKDLGKNVLLLLSGGSAFKILDYVSEDALGPSLTISVLDERYDPSNQSNNFVQLTKTLFYRKAKKAKCDFIDTSVKREQSQTELANFFEKELKNWKKSHKSGIILATLGMGPDGHIAGIMPMNSHRKESRVAGRRGNPEQSQPFAGLLHPQLLGRNDKKFKDLFYGKNWVAAYDAKNKNPHRFRVTATLTFLKKINFAFAYICGQEKAAAFKKISSKGLVSEFPVRFLKQIKNINIYTDIK